MQNLFSKLGYDPERLPRELKRHYIGASEGEIEEMLAVVGCKELRDLYGHIDEENFFKGELKLPEELSYEGVLRRMEEVASKNFLRPSFLGDGMPVSKEHEIASYVSGIRGLTTTYTPYQPERSQGTLISLWNYQCLLAKLTGFEAINASLYDRSTALFEAICCVLRASQKGAADTVVVSEGIYPGDKEVIDTLIRGTEIKVEYVGLSKEGVTDVVKMREVLDRLGDRVAGIAFTQVNQYSLLEDVDLLADMAEERGIMSIAVIDPMMIVGGGLKAPVAFGKRGVDIIVGEGQHLAIGANFGGPGLGIFGVRYNEGQKHLIRMTPGRYVGKGKDVEGNDAYMMVLSAREQHIRKDKATSNICSNQAFLATLAGAVMLAKGEEGMRESGTMGMRYVRMFLEGVLPAKGVRLAYPKKAFYNECLLEVDCGVKGLIELGKEFGLNIGHDMTERVGKPALKVSFSDVNSKEDVERLIAFFKGQFEGEGGEFEVEGIEKRFLREGQVGLPTVEVGVVKECYKRLGALNVSPDDGCFPLGSCTMKYNPYINDWAANLEGFRGIHPQVDVSDCQGSLEVLYEIQEWMKGITGLDGVTTQVVAGAQGELAAIKMFQAYHEDRGDKGRKKILIPKSAHGTNFATAVMAGFKSEDIVYLKANESGKIDEEDLDRVLLEDGGKVAGIMVTNPNTGGIFEEGFRGIARKIHDAGGLVFMDGANMNAIAGWIDLKALGVDAVHNNLHKTWSIPHGGGGPGDGIVAVSGRLVDYLPGYQVVKEGGRFGVKKAKRSIGSLHRHWGNFGHKIRCYAYLLRLGREGIRRMSGVAVLGARYMKKRLEGEYPSLPRGAEMVPRMHEFILTLEDEVLGKLEEIGVEKSVVISRIGKLFLDYGFHAPTVAFPEVYGLMIEPTESYGKGELDKLIGVIREIKKVVTEDGERLKRVPEKMVIRRVDEVGANRNLKVSEEPRELVGLIRN